MTLRLTPDLLAAAYDFLLTTHPVKSWKLPPSDEVEFHVVRSTKIFGDCVQDGDKLVIRVSEAKNGHMETLLATIAHEIIHLRQFITGDTGNHNAYFHKMARQVCKAHGYDPKSF